MSMFRSFKQLPSLVHYAQRNSSSVTRKGFGSFHSEDIETLISAQYGADMPDLMKNVHDKVFSAAYERISSVSMGKAARYSLFVHDKEWEFLNHGAFGAVMEPLLQASQHWRYECEKQPLKFIDRELFGLIAYSLRAMANFVNCPATELYPLQNVTTGLNCVLQSVELLPGDEVACFSLTYGSTKKMLKDLCDRTGAKLRIIPMTLPVANDAAVVTALTNTLTDKTRLVIIDHITSNTALELPTIQLAQAARKAGALVVVDAAHALFSQNVSIYPRASKQEAYRGHTHRETKGEKDLSIADVDAAHALFSQNVSIYQRVSKQERGHTHRETKGEKDLSMADVADVWLTNGHKWLSAPKGCAFMWVHPSVAGHLRPAVVSHGFHSHLDATAAAMASSEAAQNDECNSAENSTLAVEEGERHHKVRWWWQSSALSSPSAGRGSHTLYAMPPSKLLSSLVWDGCRDYSALLCTPLALQIWDSLPVGFDAVDTISRIGTSKLVSGDSRNIEISRAYMRTLLHAMVVPMLVREWGLQEEEDFAGPRSMRKDSPMVLVPLPERMAGGLNTRVNMEDKHAFALQEALHHDHRIEVPIKCLEGKLYVRLSAHIYNTFDQYERLAKVIKKM